MSDHRTGAAASCASLTAVTSGLAAVAAANDHLVVAIVSAVVAVLLLVATGAALSPSLNRRRA